MLTPEETISHSPMVRPVGLQGAMFSPTERNVGHLEAMLVLHRYLREALQLQIHYQAAMARMDYPPVCRQPEMAGRTDLRLQRPRLADPLPRMV